MMHHRSSACSEYPPCQAQDTERHAVRPPPHAVLPPRHAPGPPKYCLPRHRMPVNSRNEGSKCVSITWRAMGRADIARHAIG